jgi:hypothetical protein
MTDEAENYLTSIGAKSVSDIIPAYDVIADIDDLILVIKFKTYSPFIQSQQKKSLSFRSG